MKEITVFQCEICDKIYVNKEEALVCENLGKEKAIYEVGNILHLSVDVGGGLGTLVEHYKILEVEENEHFVTYHLGTEDEDGEWYESKTIIGNAQITSFLVTTYDMVCDSCGQALTDEYIEEKDFGLRFCDSLCHDAFFDKK